VRLNKTLTIKLLMLR